MAICQVHDIDAAYGYHFGNGIFYGAGTGIILNTVYSEKTRLEIPVFAEVRYSIMHDRFISPTFGARFGLMADYTNIGTGYMAEMFAGVTAGRIIAFVGFKKLEAVYESMGMRNDKPALIAGRSGSSGLSIG